MSVIEKVNRALGQAWCHKFGHPKRKRRGVTWEPGTFGEGTPGKDKEWCSCCGVVFFDRTTLPGQTVDELANLR